MRTATSKMLRMKPFSRKTGRADILFPAERIKELPIRERFEICVREIDQKNYGYGVRIHGEISSLLIDIIRTWQKNGLHSSCLRIPHCLISVRRSAFPIAATLSKSSKSGKRSRPDSIDSKRTKPEKEKFPHFRC